MELVQKKGVDPDCLTPEDHSDLAWYNSLNEMAREVVDLIVAFKIGDKGFEGVNVDALLFGFDQTLLIAA